jgi:hypothetical protein
MTLQILAFRTCVLLLISAAAAHGQEYTPAYDRIRAELQRDRVDLRLPDETLAPSARLPERTSTLRVAPSTAPPRTAKSHRSIWIPVLAGAGIGAVAGAGWGAGQCDAPDPECTAITVPLGALAGAGIGAAVGALVHAIMR